MEIEFLGANRQVTGSRHLLRAGGRRILVDCGMFQERPYLERNWETMPIPPREVDALLLTHAHLDHCGLIPRLVGEGFRGDVLATPPTMDLARIVWADAARIQAEDAEYKRRRHQREGRTGAHPEVALYLPEDAEAAGSRLRIIEYHKRVQLFPGIEVCYRDAGHILGSATVEVKVSEGGTTRTIVFSGDVGSHDRPLLRDPDPVAHADWILMESTYGDRDREQEHPVLDTLAEVVNDTVARGGNLVIPTFAIDRAQELLFFFSQLTHEGRIPRITIFLDSPMAVNATTIYKRYPHLLDAETQAMLEAGRHPFQFPGLHFVRTASESKAVNSIRGSCVIMAGSGMCTGGRVKHHLRQNIERPESTVLFVGYQASNTLGRQILQGDPRVRIHGHTYEVRARVREMGGLSAHADRAGLMQWLEDFKEKPRALFLTHGEMDAATALAGHIGKERGWRVEIPEYGSRWRLDETTEQIA
ncbi:MAG: MBL fold metallo-hydrolase [Phycisphaerales bacterium]|nr:MBL fold metallo-hydrolase [Phycisphaerales bacterium]